MTKTRFSNINGASDDTGIPVRTLRTPDHQRKISGIKAGHRTLLFDVEKLRSELLRYEVRAVK